MKNIKLNELNLDNLAIWPFFIKMGVIAGCCLLIFIVGYWFDISSQLSTLSKAAQQEITLRDEFKTKAEQVVNLPLYQKQIQQMQQILTGMVKQLPSSTEIPSLLEEISRVGTANGLKFRLFKPLPEKNQDFFIELPIQISVVGDYHQLGLFVTQIAGLDRIVTLQDFNVAGVQNKQTNKAKKKLAATDDQGILLMDIMAKTYRYPDETSAANAVTTTQDTAKK